MRIMSDLKENACWTFWNALGRWQIWLTFSYGPSPESGAGQQFPWIFAGMGLDEHLWNVYNCAVCHLVGTYIWFESWWRSWVFFPLFSWHNILNSSSAICCLFRKDGRRVYVVCAWACGVEGITHKTSSQSQKKGILQHKATWVRYHHLGRG